MNPPPEDRPRSRRPVPNSALRPPASIAIGYRYYDNLHHRSFFRIRRYTPRRGNVATAVMPGDRVLMFVGITAVTAVLLHDYSHSDNRWDYFDFAIDMSVARRMDDMFAPPPLPLPISEFAPNGDTA